MSRPLHKRKGPSCIVSDDGSCMEAELTQNSLESLQQSYIFYCVCYKDVLLFITKNKQALCCVSYQNGKFMSPSINECHIWQ